MRVFCIQYETRPQRQVSEIVTLYLSQCFELLAETLWHYSTENQKMRKIRFASQSAVVGTLFPH